MANFENIKNESKMLLDNGNPEKARELFYSNGFNTNYDPKIQKLFEQLFPATVELKKELGSSLKRLFDESPEVRKKAANYICKKARGNWTIQDKHWLADPRTTELLLNSLNDSEQNVVYYTVLALGMISQRYDYIDSRVLDSLVKMYSKSNDKIKIAIAQAIPQFATEEAWKLIIATLNCKPSKSANWTVGLAIARYGETINVELNNLVVPLLLTAYTKEKDLDAKGNLILAIKKLEAKSALDELKTLLTKETDSSLKDDLQSAISSIEAC